MLANYRKGEIIIPRKSPRKDQAWEKREELIKLYNDGKSVCQISKDTGICRSYISWVLDETGARKIMNRSDIEKEFQQKVKDSTDYIIDCYKNNMSITKIRDTLNQEKNINIGIYTIRKILIENGLIIKQAKDYNTKYTSNKEAFSKYDKYSCYWAGLLAADGCIYQRIDCSSQYVILTLSDKESVTGFKEYIEYTGLLKYGEVKATKGSQKVTKTWEVRCNNTEICKNLATNFNIHPRKTYDYIPPDTMPEELKKFFILGYIDGDGSITYTTTNTLRKQFCLNIVGTYQTIRYIQKYFKKENIKTVERFPEREVNNTTLCIQGNDQLLEILSNLYSDEEINSICMQRKYKRFLLLKEQQEKKQQKNRE